jgi:hypothetical protein
MKQRPGPSLTTGVLLMVALLVVIQASTTSPPQRGTDAEFRALIERY